MTPVWVILHLVAAATAVGAATHAAVFTWRGSGEKRLRRFARLSLVTAIGATALGMWLYPIYKVDVRLAWLEAHRPDVARLFDMKEHLVAMAMPCLVGSAALEAGGFRRALTYLGAALLWVGALNGIWVAAVHGYRP